MDKIDELEDIRYVRWLLHAHIQRRKQTMAKLEFEIVELEKAGLPKHKLTKRIAWRMQGIARRKREVVEIEQQILVNRAKQQKVQRR